MEDHDVTHIQTAGSGEGPQLTSMLGLEDTPPIMSYYRVASQHQSPKALWKLDPGWTQAAPYDFLLKWMFPKMRLRPVLHFCFHPAMGTLYVWKPPNVDTAGRQCAQPSWGADPGVFCFGKLLVGGPPNLQIVYVCLSNLSVYIHWDLTNFYSFGDLFFYLRKVTPTAPPTTCGLWRFFSLRPCPWLQRRTAAEIPGHVRWVHDVGVFVVYGGCLGFVWWLLSLFQHVLFFWWGIKHQSTWKSACKPIGDSPHELRT